jgi:digeranylgeranylglycerophospholipid reductase
MKTVDVLVVGLGPGGSSAAARAAAGGFDVLGIERRAIIGEPIQCAEFLPLPLGSFAPGPPIRIQEITGMQSILPSGNTHSSEFPGLMIDRGEFDRSLARKARAAGAELWLRSRLIRLDSERKIATLTKNGLQREVAYRVLIAADGPHSSVAARMGLAPLRCIHTHQIRVPLRRELSDTLIWLDDDYPGGYAWLFPRGPVANLGLGIDPRISKQLRRPLEDLHQRLVAEGWVGTELSQRTGGAIPVGGPRASLVSGSTIFVGDAAGLTHPITGAGIAPAVLSGERAGQAAVMCLEGDTDALLEYDEDIRDHYGTALSRAVDRRRALYPLWGTPRARNDATQRRGWIAFSEYFEAAMG